MNIERIPKHFPVSPEYQVPDGYEAGSGGVYEVRLKKATEAQKALGNNIVEVDGVEYHKTLVLVAETLCLPVRVLRDFNDEEMLELAWIRKGRVVVRAFPRAIVRSGRRLVTAAASHGFPVGDSTASAVECWLRDVEAVNDLPEVTIARQLGWQKDKDQSFVAESGKPYAVKPLSAGLDRLVDAHRSKGSLEDWKTVAKKVERLPLVQMGIYAALGSMLLPKLERESFIAHWGGGSTKGKTTTVELGVSTVADPLVAVGTWRGTRFALEQRLSLMNGMVSVLDETANVSHENIIHDLLYTVPQGVGKSLGSPDGLKPTLTWSTIVLSTGERQITSYTKDQGASARALDLYGSPFGEGGGKLAAEVREGCRAAYGTAGPAFAAALRSGLATKGGADRLRARHEELTGLLAKGGDLARRRAPNVAVLWLAAEIAWKAEVVPFEPPKLEVWLDIFGREESSDDRSGEALELVWAFIAANPHRVMEPSTDKSHVPPHGGWAGKEMENGAVALFSKEVARVLEDGRYDLDAVKAGWDERGAIRRSKDGKYVYPVKFLGKTQKMWVFEERPEGDD